MLSDKFTLLGKPATSCQPQQVIRWPWNWFLDLLRDQNEKFGF